MTDALALARDLIRCPSITPKDEGAQDLLSRTLGGLGFTCTNLPFDDVKNLFARRGTDGPHLCFAGHTDVVPVGDEKSWLHSLFGGAVADGKLYGRGAADMKGNIAAFIAATAAFVHNHPDHKGSISLLITGDEEGPAVNGTVRVLEWMAKNGHTPDVCIVGEPSNPKEMGDEITIGRRGSLSATLTVHGKQGHVAYPHLADNPVPKLAHYLVALSDTVLDVGSAHFPATSLQVTNVDIGNTAENVIPARATAMFNVRFNDRWDFETLENKIRSILDRVGPDYDIVFRRGAHVFITAPGEWTGLVRQAVTDITGKTPAMSTAGGTSDARFVSQYCPVVECGLINETIHQVDEHVRITDLETLTAIYGRVLEKYFLR